MAKRKKTSINQKKDSSPKAQSSYILLVEDEPTHAVIIRHAIQSANPNTAVKVVESLKEYRNAIANSLPEIVLIDYFLPDGKAFEILTSPPEDGQFPIVVMTNSGDEKLAVEAMKAGALDYVAKASEAFQSMPHTLERALREWKLLIERKQAEEAFRESEENFRSITENLHDVFFITDTKGNITYISPAVNLVFAYKIEEMKDHFFGEYLDESELPRILPIFENAIRTGIPSKNLELRAKRRDGKTISVELSTSIIVSHGKVKGTAGVIRDISERKRAEKELRESELRYKMFSELVTDYVYKIGVSSDGKVSLDFVSDGFYSVTGRSREEVVTVESWRGIFHPDDLGKAMGFLQRLIIDHQSGEIECRSYVHGHTLRWINIVAKAEWDEQEKRVTAIIGAVKDITARKQVEEALRQNEEKFRYVFESANVGKSITLPSGEINVNQAFCDMLGYTREELRNKKWQDITPSGDVDKTQTMVDSILAGKQNSARYHKRYIHKNGSYVWADVSIVLQKDISGNPLYFITTVIDITERRRAEESVREIVNNAPFGAHLYELESNQRLVFIGANRAADSILGVNNQQFIGKTIEEAFPPLCKTNVPDTYRRVAATGERYEMEQVDYADGTIHGAYEVHAFQTGINRMAAFFRDISERKRAEELLKHSETKYRLLADHMKDTVWLMDMNLKTTYISPSVERLRGFTLEELQQLPLDRQFTPASYQLAMKAFSEEMQKVKGDQKYNITRSLDLEFYKKDGTTYWSESLFTLIRDENGVPLSIMGEGRDITERKRIEEELFKSKMLLNETEKTGKIGGWEFDVKTMIQTWTEETFNILEVDLTKDSPKVPEGLDFITPAFRPMAAQAIQKAIECGEPYDQEWEVITAKGNKRWVHSVARVHQENGKTIRISGSFQDITERKRAEEELKESEEKYQSLFNQSVEGIYLHDFEGRIIDVNNKACLQSGYTREEILQRKVFDCHPSRLSTNVIRAEILQQWNQWQEGQTFIVEAEHQRKDGTIYPVEVSTGIVWYGNRNFILAIVKDITERKRAEEELTESEEKFAKVFHDAPVWIAITDMTDSTYLDVNDQALQVSGFTREEVIGHTSIEIGWISADDRARLIQEINDHGRITGFEMKFRAKDGRTLFGWVSGELIVIGGRSCLLTVTVDITERKRTEEELRESEKRFSILSEAAFDGIAISEKGRVIEVNEQLAAMFGYERSEMIGTEVGKFVAPESLEFVIQHMQSGSEKPYEHLSLRKNGSTFPVEIRAKSLPYKGRVVRVTAIRDITERKRVEEELRQMQKLEGLGTLAGGIAHDFNNILGIILAYNTNIKRVKNDTKKLDLATETIAKAVERGKTLVQQVLTFARKTDVTFGSVNVNDVVMEIITMIYETFPRIVTCSQNFDKAIPCINADHTQLYQALLNLCVNARDAMPKGGILSINTSMTSVASVRNHHPEAAASSYICIEISDTGEGMSEEIRKHIFEPFFTTKGIGKGTGLGLSVTFGVIQSHKGFIDVESEIGKGTTFRLYLPATQVAVTIEVKDEETLDEIPGGTETLLVVEDEEMLMASLQMVLVEKGYNVLTAGDGLAALKSYQENKNDIALVLTDLGLPNMTGLEVCQRIRAISPNEHLILATGFLDPDVKLEFIEAGIRHFLFKPYDIREVLKVIREVLDKK